MTKVKIADTETTDLQGDVVEFGDANFIVDGNTFTLESCSGSMVKPTKPISFEAMAVHGVTEEDVANAPDINTVLAEHSLDGYDYVIAHNLSYEKSVLPEEYFLPNVRQLCTLKLSRVLYEKGVDVESHKLGVLYYQLGVYRDSRLDNYHIDLHSAQSDCLVTGLVLEYMLKQHNLTLDQAWEMLYDPTVCKAGKKYQRGTPWIDIVTKDYDYVQYVHDNVEDLDPDEKSYLAQLLSAHEYVKLEQVKICRKKKYDGVPWETVVQQDEQYVEWLMSNGYLKGAELDYVESLMVDTSK